MISLNRRQCLLFIVGVVLHRRCIRVGVVFAAALFPRAVFPDGRCLFGGGEWILFFNVGVDILFLMLLGFGVDSHWRCIRVGVVFAAALFLTAVFLRTGVV